MKQKSVGLTLRVAIIALALILVAGSPALPPFDGVAYAQTTVTMLSEDLLPNGHLRLEWDAVDNADEYRLWKAEGTVTTVADWGTAPHMRRSTGRRQATSMNPVHGRPRPPTTFSKSMTATKPAGLFTETARSPARTRPTVKPTLTLTACRDGRHHSHVDGGSRR